MYANLLLHPAANFVILLLLDNGVMKTPKRRFLSLIFACLCISKAFLFKLSFKYHLSQAPQVNKDLNVISWCKQYKYTVDLYNPSDVATSES